jgi:glycosyltransferase involved in cell wall biosynthesis
LNIGFVATESPYDNGHGAGIAAYLRAMIPPLLSAGHRVTLFAAAEETRDFEAENGQVRVHHRRLPAAHWYLAKVPVLKQLAVLPLRQLEWSLAFYRQVSLVAAREKIDVLECGESGSLFLQSIAPLVIRLHGSEFAFRKHSGLSLDLSVRGNDLLEAYSSNRAAAITTPSQYQANEIVKRRGWKSNRVRVIPNPISTDVWQAAAEPFRNGNAERIVFYSGRLAPVKGIEVLLKTAKRVHEDDSNTTFVLAGPWQMPEPPAAYGLELNRKSEDGVLWLGPLKPSELHNWYKRAMLFVMPSYFESFGISVVEAMAFGVPVVCTRAGAIPETVDDGITGVIVEPGDVAQMAESISRLLADDTVRKSMGQAAKEKVLRDFDPLKVIEQNLELYRHASGSFAHSVN